MHCDQEAKVSTSTLNSSTFLTFEVPSSFLPKRLITSAFSSRNDEGSFFGPEYL